MSKKIYTQAVATTLAEKLSSSKGVKHVIHQVGEDKFKVMTEAEVQALSAPQTVTETVTVTTEDVGNASDVVETAAAIAAGKSKAWANEVVQVTVPGKITKMYVITPELEGRPRWFEIARLKSQPVASEGQVTFNCTRAALLSRKLKALADSAEAVAS